MSNNNTSLLKVADNCRFLVDENEELFFWLGDTAWELFHRLDREEADLYLKNRRDKGFNVIQAVALAEINGLTEGNAYDKKPLLKNENDLYDPTMPALEEGDYDYWDHVDYIIEQADRYGLYIAFLPTWGDKFNSMSDNTAGEVGPEIFDGKKARKYGQWLGKRYADKTNIVWVLGGDRILEQPLHFEVIHEMAAGLRAGDKGKHLITFHPRGGRSSSFKLHDEEWLDFNMLQSGHTTQPLTIEMVTKDYNLDPVKPVLDGEPRYEDIPRNFNIEEGFFAPHEIRKAAYWAVFSGSFGITYGHNCIWSMNTEPGEFFTMNWEEALDRPAARQMKHLRNLIESRPFLERIPDQSLIINAESEEGKEEIRATCGENYAFVYTPDGRQFTVRGNVIPGEKLVTSWYNPRSGKEHLHEEVENSGELSFDPPSYGPRQDWVLKLDNADIN